MFQVLSCYTRCFFVGPGILTTPQPQLTRKDRLLSWCALEMISIPGNGTKSDGKCTVKPLGFLWFCRWHSTPKKPGILWSFFFLDAYRFKTQKYCQQYRHPFVLVPSEQETSSKSRATSSTLRAFVLHISLNIQQRGINHTFQIWSGPSLVRHDLFFFRGPFKENTTNVSKVL